MHGFGAQQVCSIGESPQECPLGSRLPLHCETSPCTHVPPALAHVQSPVPPPSRYNPLLSTTIEQALLRVLAKQPVERFPRCSAFAAALATGP